MALSMGATSPVPMAQVSLMGSLSAPANEATDSTINRARMADMSFFISGEPPFFYLQRQSRYNREKR